MTPIAVIPLNYFPEQGRGEKAKRISEFMKMNPKADAETPLAEVFADRVTGKHKKDVLMLLVGERGSGKSYTLLYLAVRCAEEIAKRIGGTPADYFAFENVAVIQDEELEERMRNLKRFNVYILDDAGIGWDSRAFATNMNRKLNHILQTCRTDNCILLISVIDPFTIDKVPRTMVRYYGEIAEQLHDYGQNLVKVFRNKRLYREGKTITPHMKIGRNKTARRWIAYAPSQEIADAYDKVREENAEKVRKQQTKYQQPEEGLMRVCDSEKAALTVCDKCGYEWYSRVKNPKRCPSCTKRMY